MSNDPQNPDITTQSNQYASNIGSDSVGSSQSGAGTKWMLGMALGSAAGAALLVASLASTSAEAPVVADSSHMIKAGNKVEKKQPAKPKQRDADSRPNATTRTSSSVSKPARPSVVATTTGAAPSSQASKYGKNSASVSKAGSKAKKPSPKPNMTKGKPVGGAPVEGPINHSE